MTKKEQKRQDEISAIEQELRLLAMGALGSSNVEPEDGCDLFAVFNANTFSLWLTAVESRWGIHKREQQSKFMLRPHNLDKWGKSYTSAATFLHSEGARFGGRWIA